MKAVEFRYCLLKYRIVFALAWLKVFCGSRFVGTCSVAGAARNDDVLVSHSLKLCPTDIRLSLKPGTTKADTTIK